MRLRQLFENINRSGEGSTAVVGWGRGMGHKGHMMLASSVITHARDLGGDPYFVVSRSYGPDDPLQPEEKLEIYRKVFPEQGHIFQTATDELPDLIKILANLNQQGYTNAIVVLGKDQVPNFQYVKNYNGKPDKKGNIPYTFDSLQVISRHETNDPSRKEKGPRATPMRLVLTDPEKFRLAAKAEKAEKDEEDDDGDDQMQYDNMSDDQMQYAVWRDSMSPEVSDQEVMALMHKAKERMTQMAAEKKPKKKQGVAEGSKLLTENILTLLNKLEYLVRYFKQTHGNMGGNVLKGEMMPVLDELEKQGEHKIVSSIKNMMQNAESVDRETRGMSWKYFADTLSQQLPDIMRNASTTVKKNVPEGKLKKEAETRLK